MKHQHNPTPLVSVIIPSYNYARFLPRAIKSIFSQTCQDFEVIVVDDGSTDETSLLMLQYPSVRYFYKENSGLSDARNTGIDHSRGKYLAFLDADDWLEEDALEKQVAVLNNQSSIAFVSGNYYLLQQGETKPALIKTIPDANPYISLLQRNYIGMHAAVMFQRWVFDTVRYDPLLKACEDYDLYLTIARLYPVVHQQQVIATYYQHNAGMSRNFPLMIDSLKGIFLKHAPYIKSTEEEQAWLIGLEQWKSYTQPVKNAV